MNLEEKIGKDLSGEEARRHIEKITREIPTRLAGSEECKKMAEYLKDQMVGYGIPAEVHEFDALVGFTGTAELMVLEPEKRVIQCNPFVHIGNTTPAGLTGELIFVGSGGIDDYAGMGVQGKVTLSELSYAPPRQEKQRIAAEHGSIAQINIDFNTLKELSKVAREAYGLGGAVQHGASTLPDEAFDMLLDVTGR